MPNHELLKLRDLNVGDRFYYPGKKDERFVVLGKSEFNQLGSATRKCRLEGINKIFDKLCRKEVYKLTDNG